MHSNDGYNYRKIFSNKKFIFMCVFAFKYKLNNNNCIFLAGLLSN